MNNESTSILDLPTDPLGGGSISNNISLTASDSMQQINQNGAPNLSLDQTTINQIVSGIQKASISGATQLPSRDIPMTTTGLSNDPQVQPNYVPPPPQNNIDYIKKSYIQARKDSGTWHGFLSLYRAIKKYGFNKHIESIIVKKENNQYVCLHGRHRICMFRKIYGKNCIIKILNDKIIGVTKYNKSFSLK